MFSILIPSYNNIKYLKLCLNSMSDNNSTLKPSSVVAKVVETKGGQCPF